MSGSASSGTVRIDHSPAITAAPSRMKTMILFLAENSMMALITSFRLPCPACRPSPSRRAFPSLRLVRGRFRLCRLIRHSRHPGHPAHSRRGGIHLAFGIDQEVARRDNTLTLAEARQNLDAVTLAITGLHLPRFEVAVAAIDKDRLAFARVEHGVRRYRKFRRNVHTKFDVGVHVGLKHHARVIHIEPYF